MSENETIADIVAELQRCSDKWIDDKAKTTMECLGLIAIQSARRIEAAWKREREELDKRISDLEAYAKLWTGRADELRLKCDEFYAKAKSVGNAAAMREALLRIVEFAKAWADPGADAATTLGLIIDKAESALSLPPRQCDVGTAEEQAERQKAYCRKHFTPDRLGGNCRQCPLKDRRGWSCQLAWAQMPYEAKEGAAK